MEKPSLCRNMKQMHDFKFKVSSFDYGSGDYNANLGDGDLVAAGFSWPPRSYICSFCKREFRSAQALGGHMNVHRRDRARLRQSPTRDGANHSSSLNLNLEPNPSSYSSPSSTPSLLPSSPPPPPVSSLFTKFPQFTSKLPPPTAEMKRDAAAVPSCRPIITTDFMKVKAAKGVLGVDRFDSSSRKKRFEGFKKQGFVRLDLEIGVITPSEEELDLELRLGYT